MSSDRPMAEEAKRLYFDSKHKTLMVRAESGKSSRTDSEAEKLFVEAAGLQKLGKYKEAETLFQDLSDPAEPTEIDLHVQRAALQRLELLKGELVIAKLEQALAKIAATEDGITEYELQMAETALEQAVNEYSGVDEDSVREKVMAFATQRLKAVRKQRSELHKENKPESDTDNGGISQR